VAGGLSTFANIGQIILKPMGGTETFYMDDMYFSASAAPVNAAPEFANATEVVAVDENIDTAQVVYTASATDADSDQVMYALGGADASAFSIDTLTGEVTFVASPDYESKPSYDFTVTATDGTASSTQLVTVNVNDVTEAVAPPTPTGGVLLDFEGFPDNGDGTFALADAEFPVYGLGRGLVTVTEVDGSSRNMLKVENGDGAQWWSGLTLMNEYPGTDLIGDGSQPITMRVLADQAGNLNLELEADGATPYIMNLPVTAGWNDLSFDVSGADASVNWNKVQLRPDADGEATNVGTKIYYIDDIHFPQGVIVEAPNDPTTDEFLAGPAVAPDADAADVVSLFSDGYTSALDGVGKAGWSVSGDVTEIDVNGNTFKKFDSATFAGFEPASTVDATGMDTLSISVYRTASSELEVKLVDYGTDDAWGSDNQEVMYYIPADQMPVNQWATIDIPVADLVAGGLSTFANIGQIILKPMGGTETFYMDDMYFSRPVNEIPTFEFASATAMVAENIDTSVVVHQVNVTDANGDDLTFSLKGTDAGYFSVDALGAVTFDDHSPDYETQTSYDFTVVASDGTDEAEKVVQVNVFNDTYEQYDLGSAELASGGTFAGENLADVMDGSDATTSLDMSGGGGNDVLTGGLADDTINGGDGNDELNGGAGNDLIIAGTGLDRIDGGDGIDTVLLESNAGDTVSVNLSRTWNYSGDGWNYIANVENVTTGGGNDTLIGGDDLNVANVFDAGAGDDWVYAGGGDDVLIGGEGNDQLRGGDGNDTVVFESDDDLSVNLNTEWQAGNRDTSEGTDRLVDIENVTTGDGSDTLVGNSEANILTGGGGDDTLTGGDGADVFRFNATDGMSTDVITDFNREEGDKLELVNDTDDTIADAVITETGDGGSTVTWDELTIVLDVVVTNDDFINPIV
jgi:Ca2+-binding RTX toxin-like protein